MPVRVLPQTLINQIAAGEVIVRMASVVKELVENSIDAGATRIEVLLSDDLRDLEVRDDGCGMGREDAELSLQRHATSKITSLEDLLRLATRGFRGEALPSIASVARLEIQTRERAALSGTRVVVEGGRTLRIEAFGCPPGTRIVVRDLFYNVPARRKFLKSPVAEMNAALGILTRQALAVPSVGFRVERAGRVALEVPPAQPLGERFRALLGSALARPLLPIAHEREGVRVAGFLAHPLDARPDRRWQYLFVNARPFSSRTLSAALEQACRGFVMTGRFPIGCFFLEVAPESVDFNVHPTKEEVRFEDERHVAGALFRAVQGALEGSQALVGEMQLPAPPADAPEASPAARVAEAPQTPVPAAPAPPPHDARFEVRPPSFFTSPEALVRRAFERKGAAAAGVQSDLVQESQRFAPPLPQPPRGPGFGDRGAAVRHADGSTISAGPGERPDQEFWTRGLTPEPLGQVADTYIVARYGEDLLLIDQHAAHERLTYLQLRRQQNAIVSQSLLIPIPVELSPGQGELLRDLLPDLRALAFDLEEFGPRSWAVTALPADLQELDPVPLLLALIDDLSEARRHHALADFRDRILIRAACHGSIRAGMPLPPEQMRALLQQMQRERLSLTCPHGRPTIVRLGKADLDRQFKRIV